MEMMPEHLRHSYMLKPTIFVYRKISPLRRLGQLASSQLYTSPIPSRHEWMKPPSFKGKCITFTSLYGCIVSSPQYRNIIHLGLNNKNTTSRFLQFPQPFYNFHLPHHVCIIVAASGSAVYSTVSVFLKASG